MPVPLLSLNAQNLALKDELRQAFDRVLASGQYILSSEVEELERQIARETGAAFAIGVSSGTDALLLALMTLGIGPGDEVICPSFTFFATAGCVVRAGATPVFVDSCPICFNIDPGAAARAISPRTKAIVPVHLFGQSAEMDGIMELAREHELAVIEDAAQSFGASYRERKLGSLGTFGVFSFFPTKNFGGLGDGGMLVTSDESLAEKARVLRNHGAKPKYVHEVVGANFRLDSLQAALLSVKLKHRDAYNEQRRSNAQYYSKRLATLPGVTEADMSESVCLKRSMARDGDSTGIRIVLPRAYPHNGHIWNQYTLRVRGSNQRDKLKAFLNEREIGSEIYYPIPLHRQRCFQPAAPAALPRAEAISEECLSLPIFPELSRSQQDEVISTISDFLGL